MTEDLRVIVDADAGPLRREMRGSSVEVTRFGRTVSSQSRSAAAFTAALDKQQESLRGLRTWAGRAAIGVGGGLTLAVAHAIRTGMDFESQMARVQAVMGATGDEMDRLRQLALKLGADTKFSAGEAAEAMYELASAGFSVAETSDALPGVLSLAAASNVDLADAAEISSNALRGFGLDASESTHVADVLAEAVNHSSVEMQDLQLSMKYIAPVAKASGLSLEEMISAVAMMGDAGIKGEQAGTTLRGGLLRLVKPTKEVNEGLKTLGLTAEDLQGPNGLRSLPDIVRELREGTEDLDKATQNQALAQIFGTEALSGMLTVVEAGPRKLAALTEEFNRADGASAKAAKTMNDTVAGAFDQLTGSIETFEIQLYQNFQEPLKEALLDATDIVNTEGQHLQDALTAAMASPEFERGDIGDKVEILVDTIASELDRSDLPEQIGEAGVQAFNWALPRIAEAAGHGAITVTEAFARGFIESDTLGRLVIGGWLISKLGGFAALRAAGLSAGAQVSAGMAAGMAGGGLAGSGGGVVDDVVGGALGGAVGGGVGGLRAHPGRVVADGKVYQRMASGRLTQVGKVAGAAGGMAAGQAMGKAMPGGLKESLKGIRWARVGAIGAGLAIGDVILNEIDQKIREGSPDLATALEAKTEDTKVPLIGDMVPRIPRDAMGFEAEEMQAENLKLLFEAMTRERVKMSVVAQRERESMADQVDLTSEAREQAKRMFDLLSEGRKLGAAVSLGIDPDQLRGIRGDFDVLRQGLLTSLADIERFGNRNQQVIQSIGLGAGDVRRLVAQNYREMATAIGRSMARGEISVKTGIARQKALFRAAKLVSGEDPFGIAKGFSKSWEKAGAINRAATRDALRDLGKMPPAARQKAFDTMIEFGRGLVQKGKIPQQDLRDFVSKALTRFDDLKSGAGQRSGDTAAVVAGNLATMAGAVLTGLGIVSAETNKALQAYNAKPVEVQIRKGAEVTGAIAGRLAGVVAKADGGFIGGHDRRDHHLAILGSDEAVANVHQQPYLEMGLGVTKAMGMQPYGSLGELFSGVQRPNYLAKGGFGDGGRTRIATPALTGTAWPGQELGQGAIDMVAKAANAHLERNRPHDSGGGGVAGYSGPPANMKQLGDNAWVDSHTLAVAAYLSSKFGLSMSSGYRDPAHNAAVGGVPNSLHTHGSSGNPGAIDFTPPSSEALTFATSHIAGLEEALIHDVGSGLHLHLGFFDRGGFVSQQLAGLLPIIRYAKGGKGIWAGTSIDKTYPKSDGYSGETLPFYVAAALGEWAGLPGVSMAQIGKSENGLHPGTSIPDPPGESHGWLAINDHYNNVTSAEMRNPINTILKAKEIVGGGLPNSNIWHATKYVTGYNLHYDGDPEAIARHLGGSGAGDGSAPDLPAKTKVKVKGGEASGGGGIYAPGQFEVFTEPIDFDSIPDDLRKVRKELAERRADLSRYRYAASRVKGERMKKAIGKNVELLRKRIKALLEQQKRLIAKARREAIVEKIKRRGTLPNVEEAIANAEKAYERRAERADQTVALEPQEGPAAKAYIEGQEAPVYKDVLDSLALWRNNILGGQAAATQRFVKLEAEIGRIEALKEIDVDRYRKQKFRLPALREAIGGIRELYDPAASLADLFAGKLKRPPTGTFEDALKNVQGWSGNRNAMSPLPSEPAVDGFGGLIWDTQMAIRDLGLKLNDAGSEDQNTAWTAAKEALALQDKQNLALSQGETRVFAQYFRELGAGVPYLGAFMTGTGGLRVGRSGAAILHRDEMVVPDPKGPAGSQFAAAPAGAAAPEVTLVFSDKSAELVKLVDARVDGRVAKVDTQIGKASRRRYVAPGG